MVRFRHALLVVFLAGFFGGCGGEDQPNASAKPADVTNPDFGKNAGDLMKNANSGMGKTPKK